MGLGWHLRWRLSVLWALQWGITGSILTYLPLYFAEKDLTREQIGQLLAVSAVGLWLAPLIVGQVCDRWLATEKYLALAHFVGGVTLFSIPIATDVYQQTGENFAALTVLVGLFAAAYFPTIPLASSMTFRHLTNPDAQFGGVRIWGTVGWVLAGLSLSLWLGRDEAYMAFLRTFPSTMVRMEELRSAFSWMTEPSSSDCFRIAALLSFALSSFCVFLPATPPARKTSGAVAPLQTLSLFRKSSFSFLIGVSFVLAAVVPFYTLAVPEMLEARGYHSNWVPAVMTIGQVSEFPALLLLPFCLRRLGLKRTFACGMAAWLVRYAAFAVGSPEWLIITGIALHGVCHVFLIIVIQLYVDSQCPADLRASAQNLFAFLTMGIAMPLGFWFSGRLADWSADATTGQLDPRIFFTVPAGIVLLLLVVYMRWFRLFGETDSTAPGAPGSETAG